MSPIYIVIENGESYSDAYASFSDAVRAVKERHQESLVAQIKEVGDLYSIESILSDINTSEDTVSGRTHLYVEKGINIIIHKLTIRV